MSMLSRSKTSPNRTPSFHDFKKQASFFLREKIKSARLALTDVTPAELLAEEAIGGDSPDLPTLHRISRAAFEIGDFWRIVQVLHVRLARFDRRNWRTSYNSLIVLEHLLAHGPESVADEFWSDKDVIALCGTFRYVDEKGFDWGLAMRKKSEKILKLLEKGPLLREERYRSRKLKRGIQGFGSFCSREPASQGSGYGGCNSQFNLESKEDGVLTMQDNIDTEIADLFGSGGSSKENGELGKEHGVEEQQRWSFFTAESKPLLLGKLDDCRNGLDWEDDHPFNDHQISHSLLAGGN